ncbi:MAG: tRNA uracil 4-sulfurtransferase ThiI [Acidobacteriota bacterium]|nr:tRNA uracil 4-sulfurtransferase ThiI [Acidobacteriota bacterium]NLT34247.1 tRNA 4-thiouridine(8) synthase ThiI [Acidobacteriota bacterium]
MKRAILIHYHEINLKGNNRRWFEACLERHVVRILAGLETGSVRRFAGRLLVELVEGSPVEEITRRLAMVFGIANFAVAREVPAEIEAIEAELAALVSSTSFRSFKMDCRRGTKEFPLDSQQLNRRLGAFVQGRTGAAVRMEGPEAVFGIEIVKGRAFLFLSRIAGAGGLPSGSGGKVLSLLSGGIDSPVAAWRMMRRGCRVHHVHFHSYPHTTVESQEKVRRLLGILSRFQLESTLWMVPFAEVQREIVAYAPPALRVILYRRFMVRIAEAVARREKAAALVTGDSLGQVASQTLDNIRTISAVATMPMLRPLIGNDKEEIIRIARAIGTYETSIQPDQDCCSLFIPRHPETAADPEKAERAESGLDVARLVENALAGATRETLPADFFAPLPEGGRRND